MKSSRPMIVKILNLTDDATEQGTTIRCKFVLIDLADEIHLVFGPLSRYRYHANLVEQFCTRYSIPSGWEHHPDVYALYTKEARMRGGGYMVIDTTVRRLEIFGRSTSYGRYDDGRLKAVLASGIAFQGWEILIR